MGITLKEIAKMADVSVSTVSNIVNNREKTFSLETKQRVLEIMECYKYKPNCAARALSGKRVKNIVLIVSHITDEFFSGLATAVEEVCCRENYNFWLCNGKEDIEKERAYISSAIERGIDGIVFASDAYKLEAELEELASYGIPIITIGGSIKIKGCYAITVNNFLGTLKATRYLIKQGHTEIAYIGGAEHLKCTKERVDGFRQAMQEACLELGEESIYLGKYDMDTGLKAMEKLRDQKYSAIVAGSDTIAYGVYQYCLKNHIKIPEDLSIIGFDDIYLAKMLTPMLTTIRQPVHSIGVLAIEKIIRHLEGETVEQEFQLMVPQLIERESTISR